MEKCKVCGGERGRNKNACSRKCYSTLRQNVKKCIICRLPFSAPPSSDKVTCSIQCSKKNRQNLAAAGTFSAGIQKAHIALPHKPLTGRFDTHVNAKEWTIQAPDGTIHSCRNLKNWLRQHEDLLDGTVKQAWDGIVKIKYSMQGKRKNPSYQWKGWRLIEWGE
ncbi:hypothetical protein ACTHPH_21770 [Paenibacillus pasadenensis]|uniref:hypothetical protein n=1 Tax=Paenibacillus pasadenensis TaxID=217090 RepID=UPI000FD84807|nr:hypothetical protein [Paenibacillus pasadenensis]